MDRAPRARGRKPADDCEIPAEPDWSYYTHNGNAFYAAESNDWHIYTAGVADEDENPHPDREEENDDGTDLSCTLPAQRKPHRVGCSCS